MKTIREYFQFTRGETHAALMMLGLILLSAVFPALIPKAEYPPSDFSALLALKSDSLSRHLAGAALQTRSLYNTDSKAKRFRFDPNTATAAELRSLGFKPWLADRMLRYRSRGAAFRQKSDLLRIYGMDTALFLALHRYIDLPDVLPSSSETKPAEIRGRKTTAIVLELNTADSMDLLRLPGIGETLSKRILAFRKRLGGFYSPEQLREVYGLKAETFDLLLPRIQADSMRVQKISINLTTREELGTHPYVGYKAAGILIAYRKQHGPFRNMHDIAKTLIVSNENLHRLKYYIKFE